MHLEFVQVNLPADQLALFALGRTHPPIYVQNTKTFQYPTVSARNGKKYKSKELDPTKSDDQVHWAKHALLFS